MHARKPDEKYAWLPDEEYKPLPKDTKSIIHELRAAAYHANPDYFRQKLEEHTDTCIKSIERYKNKSAAADTPGPGPAAPDSSAVEEPGPQGKQMRNPFVV